MVPIVVFWTNCTTTVRGQVLKLVPCESCQTEYVYVLEREGVGAGTSVYGLYAEAAQNNSASGAEAALGQYLTNDFDPVPCPVCGHYQAFMFSKLIETRSPWPALAGVAAVIVGVLSLLSALYWGIHCFERPSDHALRRLGAAGSICVAASLVGAGLSAAQRRRVRRFDPNAIEDQQARIARGRNRAVTRTEFDALHQAGQLPGG